MSERLAARLKARAEPHVRRVAAALAEAAEAEMPGLTVERVEDGIALSGRGLAERLAFGGGLATLIAGLRR